MELLLVIAIVAIAFVVWKRRGAQRPAGGRGSSRRSARRTSSASQDPWAAVSIAPCEDACMAAWELQDQRFLVRQAPRLPLQDCDSPDCRCEFLPHHDRRTPGDRRSGLHTLDEDFARKGLPQRSKGRRKTDR